MIKYWVVFSFSCICFLLLSTTSSKSPAFLLPEQRQNPPEWNEQTPLSDVLWALGESKPNHFVEKVESEIQKGKELFMEGRTTKPNGKKSPYISKFYTCNNCHNTQREDITLTESNPEARLTYAIKHNLPVLQATTMYGTVNKASWYNDDYIKKYGDLVLKARNNLREATQICAQHCSQGRVLNKWEEDALMAYFWSLEYRLSDLGLTKTEWDNLLKSTANPAQFEAARKMLHEKFLSKSPATFGEPPQDKVAGYPVKEKNTQNGEAIFKHSCLACHAATAGVSESYFETDKITFKYLAQRMNSVTTESFYDLLRHGTYPNKGHRRYMPNYTEERMSNQQVEDLRAYIEAEAK